MNNIANYQQLIGRVSLILLTVIALFGSLPLFILATIIIALFLTIKVWATVQYTRSLKVIITLAYFAAMILQIVFFCLTVFPSDGTRHIYLRIIAAFILPLPFLLEQIIAQHKPNYFYLPSLNDVGTITFTQFKQNQTKIYQALHSADHIRKVLSLNNLHSIFSDLNRHSTTRYINSGSLDENYFLKAKQSLADPYLYIVISNTGTPASQLIGLFTQKQFNHASLSFDADLNTIISYNGGQKIYSPGLNPEMVQAFHQKPDASVLVYRLAISPEQKQKIIETITQINLTGSAYNILGLVTKRSLRRNIMFCSQFVYKMLQTADLAYFDKKPGDVQPTDFIELDYHRQLEYVSEIKF